MGDFVAAAEVVIVRADKGGVIIRTDRGGITIMVHAARREMRHIVTIIMAIVSTEWVIISSGPVQPHQLRRLRQSLVLLDLALNPALSTEKALSNQLQ